MFKYLLYNQFYDLKQQGKDPLKARINALLLFAIIFALLAIDIYLIAVHFSLFEMPIRSSSIHPKVLGGIYGLLFLGVIFLLSYFGFAKRTVEKHWQAFDQLDRESQQKLSKKGLLYFAIPLVTLLGALIVTAFMSI